MKTILTAKNVALSEAMAVYVEQKLFEPARKVMGSMDAPAFTLAVEVGKESRHHRKGLVWEAEATFRIGSEVLRAEARGETFQEAVDILENGITQEVKKMKGKRSAVSIRGARQAKKNATVAKAARFFRKGRIREEGK